LEGRCLARVAFDKNLPADYWSRRYSYSGEGDLLQVEDSTLGKTSYQHDAAHRLEKAILPDGTEQPYTYDPGDNLIQAPGFSAFYQGNKIQVANNEHFEFDHRDHLCKRHGPNGTVTYRHDSLDQLVEIQGPGLQWTAEYDCLGRRVQKTVNGKVWKYYWDTDRLAAEVFPDGKLRVYVYPDARSIIPLLFVDYESMEATPSSGKRFYVHCNHLGTPEWILDDAGKTVWRARINPYDVEVEKNRPDFYQPLRSPGHFYDEETGLRYNRFRYYCPALKRYLESDPAGIEGGLNLYAYTSNPLREVDLRGLATPDVCSVCGRNQCTCEGKPVEEGNSPADKPISAREKLEQHRKAAKERERVRILDEAVKKADANGARNKLSNDEQAWLDSDPENARLAIDPEGSGTYRIDEAQAAQAAANSGQIPPPPRRALGKVNEHESGADIVDGDGISWDHKSSEMGASNILRGCVFEGADLTKAIFSDVRLWNCSGMPAKTDKLKLYDTDFSPFDSRENINSEGGAEELLSYLQNKETL
jgi:RHS repeat-associated protein